MKSKKILACILTLSIASSLFLGCGKSKDSDPSKEGTMDKDQYLNVLLGNEPKSLDPAKTYDMYASAVHTNIQEALTRLSVDENGNDVIKEGIAKEWKESEDGLTWTFKLRDAKWSDGQPVTAEQFVYGITRTLDGNTASEMAYLLFPIKNAEEFNLGKVKAEELGVKAIDDKTLEIKLHAPCGYFLNMTYSKIMEPQRKDIVEKHGDKHGSDPDTLVYAGPFKISEWVHNNKIELVKNPEYWDAENVKLEKATMKIIKDESARMNEMYNGSIDLGNVSKPEWLEKLDATGAFEVKKAFSASADYSFFNQENKYFKNAKIRKAFLIANDREGTIKIVNRGLADPATAWVPPTVKVGDKEFRKATDFQPVTELMKENPDPKALFIEGLKEEGLDPDPSKHTIKLLESGTDAFAKEKAEFAQQNYQKKLGVNIDVDYVEWGTFQEKTDDMDFELAGIGVNPDYNDPITYFDMFMIGGSAKTGWKNEKYEELIKKTMTTNDQEERMKLFQEAEKIFIYEDAVISPVAWKYKNTYVRKYVKNYTSPVFGSLDLKTAYTQGRE
jgi:oligopeptide transport system substrate-binding protein